MKRLFIFYALVSTFAAMHLPAQMIPCGTDSPGKLSQAEIEFALVANGTSSKTTGIVKVIPVAVHVIYAFVGDPHNISDAVIGSQMTVLNEDFRGVSSGLDTEIEFCLAGINRILYADLMNFDRQLNDFQLKDSIQEDPARFLNVWVVASIADTNGGTRAYATFPNHFAAHPELDGIVIDSDNLGTMPVLSNPYDGGRTLVHEIGHWLSLLHVFQGGCDENSTCETQGDCCCDTPPQAARLYGCQVGKNTCKDDQPDKNDPVRNYMGYSYDDCMRTFTDCQKARMHLALETFRPNAWFPKGGDCPQFRRHSPPPTEARGLHINAHPNPFSNETSINVTVEGKETPITVTIIDAQCRQVATLLDYKALPVGNHTLKFDAPAPGMYLARVSSPWATKSIKLVSLER
jgi:Pregnancy-associated plasma protein-A